jgi:C2 domain-containing protein 3
MSGCLLSFFAERSVDGLSVQRLTLLGRVTVARVVMDRLWLEDGVEATDAGGKTSPVRGKPPRPAAKDKAKK